MIRLAKRLKKEKVTVDIVSFGEEVGYHCGVCVRELSMYCLLDLKEENAQKLTTFIDTLNGKEGKDITR